ncbi:histidine--tRNA ligase [Candidatus Wirthbacteria bacterium CG2_30_54_11]|uniref:Histidine--tRNA ligase n=1 Tax=Candidatus Wirthbacteria bacterium CG2_30_54_11 TaxID=1817892 RepID=A0A1J5J1I9_9BACT|nr:MAG: histidine--tRNA ligase [Candidatus Wirthbacteria bacterium CG2_30_54_11]
MIEPRILKGFRDFPPREAIARQYARDIIRRTFESYGFDPIETPAIEYLETFQGNIGEDEKLFFRFEDHGGRKVALRYDQTVPTCRFVAQYQGQLTMPFKRYQMQTVWRADKPQRGRYREFLQCDIDILGVESAMADAETIALTIQSYLDLGFKNFKVKISDRALYKGIEYPVIVAIDKLEKIGKDGVIAEIVSKGYSQQYAKETVERVFSLEPDETITAIFDYLRSAGFHADNYEFDNTLARSFSYSTGPIWEVRIDGFTAGAVGGGERYDQLVSRFSKTDVPGTGIAFGFDRTVEAMLQFGLLPEKRTVAEVLVTIFAPEMLPDSLALATKLRAAGINVDTYTEHTARMKKQIGYADKKGIPVAAILGPDEKTQGAVVLKDLRTGTQLTCDQSEAAGQIRLLING